MADVVVDNDDDVAVFTFVSSRPQLFKPWIALSEGKIIIQWMSHSRTNCVMQWIVIYPVDSAIHRQQASIK